MKAVVLLSALAALASAAVNVPDTHIVHEKRDTSNPRWVKRHRVSSRAVLPVRIGLAQSNLDRVHDYVREVSDPTSSKYGQYWSSDEVIDHFKPSAETVEAVKGWLSAEG